MLDTDVLWPTLAAATQARLERGHRRLLNESVLRHLLIELILETVPPDRIQTERRYPGVGPVDLVVDDVAIELKFPRDPIVKNPPDTMTVGQLLNDLVRLSRLPVGRAFAVHLLERRFVGHLERRPPPRPYPSVGEDLLLDDEKYSSLPVTSRKAVRGWAAGMRVTSRCEFVAELPEHVLAVHRVASGVPFADRGHSARVSASEPT